jgi:predicted Zn-dependent protease
MRAVDRNDIPVARTAIAALLAVHPGSYAAFEMLADIADREGQRAEANAMAQQAADQLSSGRDVMFARWADQRMVQQAANALALRARRPR